MMMAEASQEAGETQRGKKHMSSMCTIAMVCTTMDNRALYYP